MKSEEPRRREPKFGPRGRENGEKFGEWRRETEKRRRRWRCPEFSECLNNRRRGSAMEVTGWEVGMGMGMDRWCLTCRRFLVRLRLLVRRLSRDRQLRRCGVVATVDLVVVPGETNVSPCQGHWEGRCVFHSPLLRLNFRAGRFPTITLVDRCQLALVMACCPRRRCCLWRFLCRRPWRLLGRVESSDSVDRPSRQAKSGLCCRSQSICRESLGLGSAGWRKGKGPTGKAGRGT